MAIAEQPSPKSQNWKDYCQSTAEMAKAASRKLAQIRGAIKNRWLLESAKALRDQSALILAANDRDVANAPTFGLSASQIDRLKLDFKRIDGIAKGLEEVAALPDPVGEIIESSIRPNGLEVMKKRVPLGVVFFIYESRPNVTADAAAICVKSGNAVILRGGKEAAHSSRAIVDLMQQVADNVGLPREAIHLVSTADREVVSGFLSLPQWIDVAIPRGGESLIRRVSEEAKMPVIKHFTGNCHVYVDASANLDMAIQIIVNAKCQRMGVCNACESLVVHESVAPTLLPKLTEALGPYSIEIRADEAGRRFLPTAQPATESDFAEEFLGPIISVKVVRDLHEAIAHIEKYGSHHTDAIVTNDLVSAQHFVNAVDSSAVLVNASTRFNDGFELGLGAEIGISTDKFHARGPCGLKELTSYKYVIYGEGQIRG